MLNFEFHTPTRVIFGKETHKRVGEIVKGYGFKKVLIHYGGGSVVRTGLLAAVEEALANEGIEYIELGGVQPNPVMSLAEEGGALCRKEGVDLVLAVGGGSVIDSAKGVAVAAKNPDVSLWKFLSKELVPEQALPMATILTLAASGSEMSASCVLTNEDGMLKRGYNSVFHRPLFSILNPELTYTVSHFQTGCGIVDIMMHTLERYFSKSTDVDLTDRLAEGLLTSVIEAGRKAIADPCDYEARATLMWAGSLSHNDLTGAGRDVFMPVHQIEHELSGYDDKVAHGAGLSVLFLAWARYICPLAVHKFAQYAVRVWNCEMNFENPMETALAGIRATEEYFKSIDMPTRMAELGISEEAFDEIAEKATFFGTRVMPDYKELRKPEILEILREAL